MMATSMHSISPPVAMPAITTRGLAPLHPDVERIALLGWRCIPVARNRSGYWKGYLDQATTDLDQLEQWARAYPRCNWSVIPEGSGIWALDIDVPGPDHDGDGVTWLSGMTERHGPLPSRPHGRSGGGGHLLVFRGTGAPIKRQSGFPTPGVDPRAGRMQFTVAPSVHRRTGNPYRWHIAPWEVAPPKAPGWLLQAVAPPPPPSALRRTFVPTTDRAQRRLSRAYDTVTRAPAGTRNATLNREAYAVGRWVAAGLLDENEAVAVLYSAGRAASLDDQEIQATIKSGCAAGYRNPLDLRSPDA